MNKFLSEDEIKGRHSEEKKELERQISQKDSALQEYRREHGKLEVFFNRVIQAIDPISPFDSVFNKTYKKPKKSTSLVVPVMQNTDAHMGAVQEADEIEQFNEFNPEICDRRILGFAKGYLDWVLLHRNAYNIKNCHVIFTGDLLSGDIHEELRITNAFPVTKQIVKIAQTYVKQLALLAPYFEIVTVDFLTEDNHSRLTKKPQAKEAGINSYGYLIAEMMQAYLAKHKNIVFNIHPMHEKVIHISNLNYLIMHGHGILSYMGVPWYSIERRAGREAVARQAIIMNDLARAKEIGFHKIIHGHFHVQFDSSLYSCGGSVSGTDAYDHRNGRHAFPSQCAWMVHPKYGEFDRINFQLNIYDKG